MTHAFKVGDRVRRKYTLPESLCPEDKEGYEFVIHSFITVGGDKFATEWNQGGPRHYHGVTCLEPAPSVPWKIGMEALQDPPLSCRFPVAMVTENHLWEQISADGYRPHTKSTCRIAPPLTLEDKIRAILDRQTNREIGHIDALVYIRKLLKPQP